MGLCRLLAACSAAAVGTMGLFHGFGDLTAEGLQPRWDTDTRPPGQEADSAGPDILITSTGGVGTTKFIHEMFTVQPPLQLNSKDDLDHMKHAPFQKLLSDGRTAQRMRDVKRIVYLHGEPIRGILSLAHRGYLNIQARKVRTDPVPKGLGPFAPSLQQLVEWDGDYLQLEEHFRSFFNQCQYPIVFVDVTKKTQEIEKLAAFLGVGAAELRKRLSPWRQRKRPIEEETTMDDLSKKQEREQMALHYNVSVALVDALERKYAGLKERLSALGALLVKPKGLGSECATAAGGPGNESHTS